MFCRNGKREERRTHHGRLNFFIVLLPCGCMIRGVVCGMWFSLDNSFIHKFIHSLFSCGEHDGYEEETKGGMILIVMQIVHIVLS